MGHLCSSHTLVLPLHAVQAFLSYHDWSWFSLSLCCSRLQLLECTVNMMIRPAYHSRIMIIECLPSDKSCARHCRVYSKYYTEGIKFGRDFQLTHCLNVSTAE